MVFIAFFNAGLWILSVGLMVGVLHPYDIELAQLMPNSIVRLGVREWVLRDAGTVISHFLSFQKSLCVD